MTLDPALALISVAALGLAAVALFWPDRGWVWRLRRAFRASERELAEDALKHLFDCEYKSRIGNLQSLSGALSISGNRAAEILQQLEAREWIKPVESGYRLTGDGRSYALRIVRIHRLWERYLSDETGYDPQVWHQKAELHEHTTSTEEADAMSARLGHPRFDPHGDPIPTAGGDILPPQGRPLPELPPDTLGEIVHIEDEPEAIYAQLVAEGLHPGMRVQLLDSSPERIQFVADANEHILAPVLAANVSVVTLTPDAEMAGPVERLSSLAPGESARVVSISPYLRPQERRRMLDLGLLPGTEVQAEIRSPAGDPTGYRIRGAVIALRREQADQVEVER